MIWFTSDWHFNHKNILALAGRPFDSVESMNQILIQNLNKCVEPDDTLYVLGDIAFGNKNAIWPLLSHIHCKNVFLALGNHDRKNFMFQKNLEEPFFKQICKSYDLHLQHEGILLHMSHYPPEKPMDSVLYVFGHIHSHNHYVAKQQYDVGVDANDFHPVSLDTIRHWYYDDQNLTRS